MTPANEGESVEELRHGRRELRVRSRGGTNLLEPADSEHRAYRTERVRRESGHGNTAALEGPLVEITSGIAEAKLVQGSRGERQGVIRGDGVTVIEPDEGPMACGEHGPGRLPEPGAILKAIQAKLAG